MTTASVVLFMEFPTYRSRIVGRIKWQLQLEKQSFRLFQSALSTLHIIMASLGRDEGLAGPALGAWRLAESSALRWERVTEKTV